MNSSINDATAKALYWQKQAEKTVGLVAAFETYYYNNCLQVSKYCTGEEAVKLVSEHDSNSFHLLHTFRDENEARAKYSHLWRTANPNKPPVNIF